MNKFNFVLYIVLFCFVAISLTSVLAHATWYVPNGATNVINVTVNNIMLSPIPAGTQIFIPFNALNYTAQLNANSNNIEMFNGVTGNTITSWIEGNTTNQIQTTGLNTVPQLGIWVVLPSSIGAGVNAVNVLSIATFPFSTVSLQASGGTGEAPQLSCPQPLNTQTCGTYGKYDDGSATFNFYTNFVGTTLNTGEWNNYESTGSVGSTTAIIVNNGLTLIGNGNTCGEGTVTAIQANSLANTLYTSNLVLESYITGPSTSNFRLGYNNNLGCPTSNTIFDSWGNSGGTPVFSAQTTVSGVSYIAGNTNVKSLPSNYLVGIGVNTLTLSYTVNYVFFNSLSISANIPAMTPATGIFVETNFQPGNYLVQWIRTRANIPIQPTIQFGSAQITSGSYSIPYNQVVTLSNTFIDQGQSIKFTANVINGQEPFTYNFLVVNTVTNAIIANYLVTGINSQSNSFLWTPATNLYVGNSVGVNVIITDAHPTTVNTIYNDIGYNSAANIVISSISNTLLDSGQYVTFTIKSQGGTGARFNAQLWNQTLGINQNQGSNILILSIGGTNTITIQVHSTTNGNTFTYNAQEYDEGTTTPFTNNSIGMSFTVNTAEGTPTLILSNTLLDSGQYVTLTASGNGGTLPYTYTFYNTTSGSAIAIGSCTSLSTAKCTIKTSSITDSNTFSYNVVVTDFAGVAESTNSVTKSFTVNIPIAQPTIATKNTLLDAGQLITISSYVTHGTLPYVYNFIIFNSISNTILANQITLSNTFSFTTNSQWTTNSPILANVQIIDSATTNSIVNSVLSSAMTVNQTLVVAISPGSASIVLTNPQTLTGTITAGQPPYTYNWIVSNSAGIIFNALYVGNSFTSNQFKFTPIAVGTYQANVVVTDTGTVPSIANSINSVITVTSGSVPSFSASNSFSLVLGQNTLLTGTCVGSDSCNIIIAGTQIASGTTSVNYNFQSLAYGLGTYKIQFCDATSEVCTPDPFLNVYGTTPPSKVALYNTTFVTTVAIDANLSISEPYPFLFQANSSIGNTLSVNLIDFPILVPPNLNTPNTISTSIILSHNLYGSNIVITSSGVVDTNGFSIISSGNILNLGTINTGNLINSGIGQTTIGTNGNNIIQSFGGSGGGGGGGCDTPAYGGSGGNTLSTGGVNGISRSLGGTGKNSINIPTSQMPGNILNYFYGGNPTGNITKYLAGAGGGGGGGAGFSCSGSQVGGNGGNGGYGLYIQGQNITAGTINTNGISGSEGGAGGAQTGGGGGGGGGSILLAYTHTYTAGTYTLTGGSGGSGTNGGGAGGGGGNGLITTWQWTTANNPQLQIASNVRNISYVIPPNNAYAAIYIFNIISSNGISNIIQVNLTRNIPYNITFSPFICNSLGTVIPNCTQGIINKPALVEHYYWTNTPIQYYPILVNVTQYITANSFRLNGKQATSSNQATTSTGTSKLPFNFNFTYLFYNGIGSYSFNYSAMPISIYPMNIVSSNVIPAYPYSRRIFNITTQNEQTFAKMNASTTLSLTAVINNYTFTNESTFKGNSIGIFLGNSSYQNIPIRYTAITTETTNATTYPAQNNFCGFTQNYGTVNSIAIYLVATALGQQYTVNIQSNFAGANNGDFLQVLGGASAFAATIVQQYLITTQSFTMPLIIGQSYGFKVISGTCQFIYQTGQSPQPNPININIGTNTTIGNVSIPNANGKCILSYNSIIGANEVSCHGTDITNTVTSWQIQLFNSSGFAGQHLISSNSFTGNSFNVTIYPVYPGYNPITWAIAGYYSEGAVPFTGQFTSRPVNGYSTPLDTLITIIFLLVAIAAGQATGGNHKLANTMFITGFMIVFLYLVGITAWLGLLVNAALVAFCIIVGIFGYGASNKSIMGGV